MTYTRHSTLHGALAHRKPAWGTRDGMPVAMRFTSNAAENALHTSIVIADVSFLRKRSVKGPGAAEWLNSSGVQPPLDLFAVAPLHNNTGIVARVGRTEYFVESGPDESAPIMDVELAPSPSAHPMERHDTALLAVGPRVPDLLAQTCGLNIIEEFPDRIVLTRMAAVSAMLLYRPDTATLRVWCDPSFGVYLFEALLQIAQDLGGAAAGVEAIEPLLR